MHPRRSSGSGSGYVPPGVHVPMNERRSDGSFGELDFHQEVHESMIREAQPEAVMMGVFSKIDNRFPNHMPLIYMTISAVLISVNGFFTEVLTGILDPTRANRISSATILFYRSLLIIVILFVYVKAAKIPNVFTFMEMERDKQISLGISGFFGAIAAWTFIESLDCLPFSEATALMMLYPLVYSIINWIIFKVAISRGEQIAILSSIIGIYMITRPHELFIGTHEYVEGAYKLAVSKGVRFLGFLFCLVQALTFASYGIMVRITGNQVNPLTTVSGVLLISTVLGLLLMLIKSGFEIPSLHELILLCFQALSFFLGTLFSTHAYNTAENKSNLLVIVNYSQIVYSMLFDIFLIGDMPELFSLFGTVIIIAGGLVSYKMSQE